MAKIKTKFVCNQCGYETGKWLGKCPMCMNFSTFEEEVEKKGKPASNIASKVTVVSSVEIKEEERISSNIKELDRVLGGGIVQGSLTLVGGDPGIGKSTLLLQLCQKTGEKGVKVLYVSGEESVQQIKLRAIRLNVTTENLMLLAETNFDSIESVILDIKPDLVIIDSIQTMFLEEISSAPGSVVQVRECTSKIMSLAKRNNIPILIVGHVTKDGAIAGPRILEHMVDTVLYFEGERMASYRILRAVKNRFGSTNEIGVFEMRQEGLIEIANPSEFMLSGRPLNVSGSVVTCSLEGTRPILAEVQALVSYTNFNMPRRTSTGADFNRVTVLMAVLEKRAGFKLSNYDVYVNLAGGIKILEPAIDAAILTSVASSYKNKPIDGKSLIFGEVGLTGEIRAVSMAEKRIMEAKKLGFETIFVPKDNLRELTQTKDVNLVGISNINELLGYI